jgi:hypothetical protein
VKQWEPLRPEDAAELLRDLDAPWWIAGGWSLDLFLGYDSRPHKDLDVAVLRRDQRRVFEALADAWVLEVAHDGGLTPWDGSLLPDDRHGVWARPRGAARWQLELVFDEADGEVWEYRRDRRVTRSLVSLGPSGGPQPPEVTLLYKARDAGHKRDWQEVAPRLDDSARWWLAEAIAVAHPESPYLELL